MCSTGKSNPNTPQICLSAPLALQHCFSAQAGLGKQCPSGQRSSCPPSLPPCAPCTQAKAPMGRSPHGGKSFPSLCWMLWAGKGCFWRFCSFHQHAKKCWKEPVFLYKKLNECVPLTSWDLRCRSSLIPLVNPAAVTYQQIVLLLTFYLTEAQVSQGRFLSSRP